MNIKEYIKDKQFYIVLRLSFLIFVVYILGLLQVEDITIKFIITLWVVLNAIEIIHDYNRKSRYYNETKNILNDLDKKYLLPVVINRPEFIEGQLLYDVISVTDKGMHEEVNKYIFIQEEYKEYIDMWVHEIKTPIASSKLIIENNKNEHTLSILEEIEKIENYIEQVLYYSKSNELEKDYIVKEISLRQCVNNTIKRNKKAIRDKGISIDIQDFNKNVHCDNKWVEFILNQIIINSVKYIGNKSTNKKLDKSNGKIKIYIEEHSNSTELFIKDNGIGIDEKDLRKVFEKGFTGLNGRKLKKSTGMGLYISKKLADKMSLGICIDSKINEYTVVKITFPENNMMKIINN